MTARRWLHPWHAEPDAHPVLLCIPPAGSGCGQYAGWQSLLGPSISTIGVQLPGREDRWTEPMPSTIGDAVDAVESELTRLLPPHWPALLYGHSFGGLLAYELCRRLDSVGRRPVALVVASCRPPHAWVGAGRGLVDNESELGRLLDLRGLSEDDIDEDSRELMLHVLRQDAQLSLTYVDPHGERVGCPIHAWGGSGDEIVSSADLDGWAGYTGSGFFRRQFPGGHHLSAGTGLLDELRGLLVPHFDPGAMIDAN
ncbi:MAG TPA: thioesterase domain-containing protein [Jatrophihabitans sp.]|nr:thioesterase domain-containing protein [Jatrophihabitans sp.]